MPRLDHIMQEVVFYAVREAVRNAALHGRGQSPDRSLRLTISIHYDEDDLSIVVQDDGVGPESQARRSDPHLASGSQGGLALHGTLLAAVGGHLMIESISEGGTQVSIIVPALVEEHT